jgi:hypothetical protein
MEEGGARLADGLNVMRLDGVHHVAPGRVNPAVAIRAAGKRPAFGHARECRAEPFGVMTSDSTTNRSDSPSPDGTGCATRPPARVLHDPCVASESDYQRPSVLLRTQSAPAQHEPGLATGRARSASSRSSPSPSRRDSAARRDARNRTSTNAYRSDARRTSRRLRNHGRRYDIGSTFRPPLVVSSGAALRRNAFRV